MTGLHAVYIYIYYMYPYFGYICILETISLRLINSIHFQNFMWARIPHGILDLLSLFLAVLLHFFIKY